MTSAMEKALVDKLGIPPQKAKEDRQKFLGRVMAAVRKLTDDKWEELAEVDGAQDWYNAATEEDNEDKPISDFPDAAAPNGAAAPEDDEDADPDPKPAKGAKAGKAKDDAREPKPAAAKGAKAGKDADAKKPADAPAPKKAGGAKAMSPRRALKTMLVKKPTLTTEDLIEQLEKKGHKLSKLTVTSIRADTRDTIRVLNDAGITDIAL